MPRSNLRFSFRVVGIIYCLSFALKGQDQPVEATIPKWGLPIIVDGKVCGTEGGVVIDTGSSFSTVSRQFEPSLSKEGNRRVLEADGVERVDALYSGAAIAFGTFLTNDPAYIGDFSSHRMVVGRNISAILGSGSLLGKQIYIHQSRGRLFVADRTIAEFAALMDRGFRFSVTLEKRTPRITLNVSEGVAVEALIDTGDDGSMTLNKTVFDDLVEQGRISVKGTRRIAAASGFSQIPYGRMDHFTFCDVRFENLVVNQAPEISSIGLEILSRFIWAIDYPNTIAYFLRDPEYLAPFDLQNGFGALLGYLPGGDAQVFQVAEDSPAEKAGIRKGDIILALGALQTGAFSKQAVIEWLTENRGRDHSVKLQRDGQAIEVHIFIPR